MPKAKAIVLPASVPEGGILLGPLKSSGAGAGVRYCDEWEGVAKAARSAAAHEAILLLIHGDCDAGRTGTAARRLRELRRERPGLCPVLVYEERRADDLVELFRAGLWDGLSVPVDEAKWERLIERFDAERARLAATALVHGETNDTSRQLQEHRRSLRSQVAVIGDELLQAQQRLEVANQELTDHMEQLSLLYALGRELSMTANWDRALEGLLENLAGFVGAGGAALILKSAPGGHYRPRQTYRWEEPAWDRVLVSIEDRVCRDVAEGIVDNGVHVIDRREAGRPDGDVIALPLEHQGLRLGFLLLMQCRDDARQDIRDRYLPFLQTVQVILAEEVAGAQMLDRLREMGSFNARVLETVRSGIWVIDALGRTVYCNRTGLRLVGSNSPVGSAAETSMLVGRGRSGAGVPPGAGPVPSEALRDIDQPELFLDGMLQLDVPEGPLFRQLLDQGDDPFRGEGRIVRRDGEALPVLVQTSIMDGRGRDEKWLVVVVEDLRAARRLEAERIRGDRLESMVEMSATLAHEIRNPLMGLSAQAELLGESLPDDDRRRRYLDVITREVDRINETISRLLNFVRPYEAQLLETDLHELALDTLELVRRRAEEAEVQLRFAAGADEGDRRWRRAVDGGQIKQVVLNLLLNAIDASPVGSTVEMRLDRCERIDVTDPERGTCQMARGVGLTIVDEGAGFGDVDIEKLFRPFFTTKSSGTGLGLSICRKIVRAHRGEISCRRDGRRTIFAVNLPDAAEGGIRARSQEAS